MPDFAPIDRQPPARWDTHARRTAPLCPNHRAARPGWLFLLPILLAGAALTLIPPRARGGELSPVLRSQLASLPSGGQVTALFTLESQADVQALCRALKIAGAGRHERHRRVIEALQDEARKSQGAFLTELEASKNRGQVSGYTPYWIRNLVVVRGTREAIEDLAQRSDVSFVEPTFRARSLDPIPGTVENGAPGDGGPRGVTPGLRAIGADRVWRELGINGAGVIIASMDTGVDGTHPALSDRWRGATGHPAAECWLDVRGSSQFPVDDHFHGTYTTGIMTGLAVATEDTIGVAWGAEWIACNPLNQSSGPEFDNDIIHCFQWLADPDGDPETVTDVPAVVQNSWIINSGFPGDPPYTPCDARWWDVIDNCEAAGVVVIFSAGNSGPDPYTVGSPSDRASTPYNVFSVGAVDATNYSSPYPIAEWSSRGPTACDVPPELIIKPEVVAPGVDIYSSVPGGDYAFNSGTSAAGPHVSGVVALMCEANPDLDAETVKQILFDTAHDGGEPGDDNSYGHGVIDAYEAVLVCGLPHGTLTGTVRNASNGGSPIPMAQVRVVEIERTLPTGPTGHYTASASPGTYTLEVTHPSFLGQTVLGVVVTDGQVTVHDFSLIDVRGPSISGLDYLARFPEALSPIGIAATITDLSAISSTEIFWRVNGGGWQSVPMSLGNGGEYETLLPGQPFGSVIEFYVRAVDIAGNTSLDPPEAPGVLHQIDVVLPVFRDDAETDHGWSLVQNGDAQNGRWARGNPIGTEWNGEQVEPSDDHTPSPGIKCFVTGVGSAGGPPGQSDVDAGCVTLTSPAVDLSCCEDANLTYWRWFAKFGSDQGGSFQALVSPDGGATWTELEAVENNQNAWNEVVFALQGIVPLTSQMKFRFVACDTGDDTLIEAAIDDVLIDGVPLPSDVNDPVERGGTWLLARPSPFSRETTLHFRLDSPGPARLGIFDGAGRGVRLLADRTFGAGISVLYWDGRDDAGRPAAAGVYFGRLSAGGAGVSTRILLVR